MNHEAQTPVELPTAEQFMERFVEAVGEAGPLGDQLKFVITTIHRSDVDSALSNLALYVNTEEGISTTLTLTTDQVMELMDVMLTQPGAKMPKFGVEKIKQALMSVYDGECPDVEQSEEIAENVDRRSAYQGVSTEVVISLSPISQYELVLNVSAEYFLDTQEEERELLRQKGIDHIHEPRVVNHRELLFTMSTCSMLS